MLFASCDFGNEHNYIIISSANTVRDFFAFNTMHA